MNRRGFGLFELLIVVAILVILAWLGIPQYIKANQRRDCRQNLTKIQKTKLRMQNTMGFEVGTPTTLTQVSNRFKEGFTEIVGPTEKCIYSTEPIGVDPICESDIKGHKLPKSNQDPVAMRRQGLSITLLN